MQANRSPSCAPFSPAAAPAGDGPTPSTGTSPDGRLVRIAAPAQAVPSFAMEPLPRENKAGDASPPARAKRKREGPAEAASLPDQAAPVRPGLADPTYHHWQSALDLLRDPKTSNDILRQITRDLGQQLARTAGASPAPVPDRLAVQALDRLAQHRPWLGEILLLARWMLDGARLLPLRSEAVLERLLALVSDAEARVPSTAPGHVDPSAWIQVVRLCDAGLGAAGVALLLEQLEARLHAAGTGRRLEWVGALVLAHHLAVPAIGDDQADAIAVSLRRIRSGSRSKPALQPGDAQPWSDLLPVFVPTAPAARPAPMQPARAGNAWPVEVLEAACRLVARELADAVADPAAAPADAARWQAAALRATRAILDNLGKPATASGPRPQPRLAALATRRAAWDARLARLPQDDASADAGTALERVRLQVLAAWHDQLLRATRTDPGNPLAS